MMIRLFLLFSRPWDAWICNVLPFIVTGRLQSGFSAEKLNLSPFPDFITFKFEKATFSLEKIQWNDYLF